MEILQFILSLLKDKNALTPIKRLLEALGSNSNDTKSILSNLNIDKLLPVFNLLFNKEQEKNPTETVGSIVGLSPVASIADRDIVYALNKYLSSFDYS